MGTAVVAAAVVLLLASQIIDGLQEARRVARDSAQSALWWEIKEELRARDVTGDSPEVLSELPLKYNDGGRPEMLTLFEYRRDGETCTVSTVFRGEKLTASLPEKPLR